MTIKKLEKIISLYFNYYNFLVDNLERLYRLRIKEGKLLIPAYRNEIRLLALCYLDALTKSANSKSIGVFVASFSKNNFMPNLVSSGRVYVFASHFLKVAIPKASIKPQFDYLGKYYQRKDLKDVINIITEIESYYNTHQKVRLLFKALKEFEWGELRNQKRANITLPVTSVDKDSSTHYNRFIQFINRGPDPFYSEWGIKHTINKNKFHNLTNKPLPKNSIIRLFEFFKFSEIIRRDYRNPMVHTTISLSQGREIADDISEPYYWFNAVRKHKIRLELVIPDKYWLDTLKTSLKSYRQYCVNNSYNPIPTNNQILYYG